jgi:hypothetical protein
LPTRWPPGLTGTIAESIGLAMGQVQVFEAAESGRLTFGFPFAPYGRLLSSLSNGPPPPVIVNTV